MPTLEVEGGAVVSFTDTGAPIGVPDAPTVVFGHGLLFGGWMFDAQVAALCSRFRCVAIDWRGQATSPESDGGYDMDTLSRDAITIIESLDVGPVHYAGLSMGGFIGMRVAARRRDLVRSLTLIDTSPDREESFAAVQDIALAGVYRLLGLGPVAGQVLPIMFGPTRRKDPAFKPVMDEFLRRAGEVPRGGVSKAVLGVALRKPVYDELSRITAPTLVVVGADDKPTPVTKARRIHEAIAGSRLEIVPDCGHSSAVEQPEALTALLDEFLAAASR